jgi:DNA-binding Lrp family transcriptional regulator
MREITVAQAIIIITPLILDSRGMTLEKISKNLKISKNVISRATRRLIDSGILERDRFGVLTVAPQEKPEGINIIQLVVDKGDWERIIRALIIDYFKAHLEKTGRNHQRIFRVRKYVRKHVSFLFPSEDREHFNDAINTLCIEGILVLEKAESDRYRFYLPNSCYTGSGVESLVIQEQSLSTNL